MALLLYSYVKKICACHLLVINEDFYWFLINRPALRFWSGQYSNACLNRLNSEFNQTGGWLILMYSHCHKSIEVVRFNIRSLPACLPTPSSSYASASSPSHSSHIYVASFDWWCFSHRPGVSHSDKNRPAKRSAVHSSTYGSPSRLIVMVARLFCAMHCVHGVCLHPSEQWTRMNRTRQCACTCRYLPLI